MENEKLKVITKCSQNGLDGVAGDMVDLKQVSKEKLVYELGGKDGA